MKHCAFLTLDEEGHHVIDDEHAVTPLETLGWRVSTVSWRQSEVPWECFDVVIVRSTWDYWNDVKSFLDTLAHIDRVTSLANPLEMIHWNLEKTYLRDLENYGIGVVPTLWPESIESDQLADYEILLKTNELVVKPVVGANGDDVYRISTGDSAQQLTSVCNRFKTKRGMVQKFMPNILLEGEFSLFFFSGKYSHAIRKVPRGDEFRSQEEHGSEILPVTPGKPLLNRGKEALEALSSVPLYARVDFVRDEQGHFLVMELELIEPSMYLRTDPAAPLRFARAIDQHFSISPR